MQLFANNADSELNGAITDSTLSLTLKAGGGAKFPSPTGGDFCLVTLYQKVGAAEVNHEIVKCTARSGDVLTVVRAQEGTVARAFANADPVELRATAGTMSDALAGGADVYTYDSRATLRSQTPNSGDQAIVEGLGLFVWESGSTEPDDDESCFATASGRWLMQAASWDLVDAWQAPDDAARDELDEDQAAKMLTGSATCAIATIAAATSASFSGTVTGAAIGDRVIATPPAQLGADAANTGRLSYHAWVSAANTVTVMLTNASAAIATLNAAIQTTWPITVIKS